MAEEKKTTAAEAKAPAPKKAAVKKVEDKTETKPKAVAKTEVAAETKKAAVAEKAVEAKKEDVKTDEKKAADKKEAKKPAKKAGKTIVIKDAKKAKKTGGKLAKGTVEIVLYRGLAACKKTQISVAHSLGLKRVGDGTIQPDNAATNGKIAKIAFLIKVRKA